MKPSTRQNADELGESIAELWQRFCLAEHDIPHLLGMPRSTWDVLKRQSSPKIFSIGKRNYVLVEDLREWLKERRDSWEPRPPKRAALRARVVA
jgi:hypothetical protein